MLFLALLVVNWIIASVMLSPQPRTMVSYTFFLDQVSGTNVESITSTGETIEGNFKSSVAYVPPERGDAEQVTRFTTQRPTFANDNLFQQLQSTGVPVNPNPPDAGAPIWQQLLLGFGPTLLLVWLLISFARRAGGGAGVVLGSFGRSRATRYGLESGPRTTFADVAGIDDVKSEVTEIVDFLCDPEKYRRLGAKIPRGVLLSGPPGSGKTLLGRAVAGEAQVPFRSPPPSSSRRSSASGPAGSATCSIRPRRWLRRLFHRRAGLDRPYPRWRALSGNDEREQTLNQILTEMDGFTGNEGIVVLAATNRPKSSTPPDEAVSTLVIHRQQLDRLAHALFTKETLNEDEAYAAAGVSRTTAPGALARGEVTGVPPEPGIPRQPPPDSTRLPLAGT